MHATKLPTATWLEAAFLVLASSKGVSSVALARHLGVSQRTAWKLGHALRLMMRPDPGEAPLDGVVEVDDLADGGNPARRNRARYGAAMAKHIYNPRGRGADKERILVAVERGGRARTAPIADGSRATVEPAVRGLVEPGAHLMTDSDRTLTAIGKTQAGHDAVDHGSGTYVRGEAHVNTAEAFNLYLRRAKMGVWHVWSKAHLRRYLDELQFHWDHRPSVAKKGRTRIIHATPVIVRMRQVFSRAFGRELRRTVNSSIREVDQARDTDPF